MIIRFLFLIFGSFIFGQNIKSIQLFNHQTNDETPVIGFGQQLILRFDDLNNGSDVYRYTIKHLDRNWQDDGLFFTEYATGNYEIMVYKDTPRKPLFKKRFCVVENTAKIGLNVTRYTHAKTPELNQRVEVRAVSEGNNFSQNINSISLNVIQNNNFNVGVSGLRPSSSLVFGNQLIFQQLDLTFSGNNEFFYFDNKNLNAPMDMVRAYENIDGVNYTYLFPAWTSPFSYQYQPDVNGAFYFRSNNMGQERDAHYEGDYSWVVFSLEGLPFENKEVYVLGQFNDYQATPESRMFYDQQQQKYVAHLYLKQGFYNYILATKSNDENLNLGEINGNFWQTQNQYQAFLYYTPFGKNYDALMGYGEIR